MLESLLVVTYLAALVPSEPPPEDLWRRLIDCTGEEYATLTDRPSASVKRLLSATNGEVYHVVARGVPAIVTLPGGGAGAPERELGDDYSTPMTGGTCAAYAVPEPPTKGRPARYLRDRGPVRFETLDNPFYGGTSGGEPSCLVFWDGAEPVAAVPLGGGQLVGTPHAVSATELSLLFRRTASCGCGPNSVTLVLYHDFGAGPAEVLRARTGMEGCTCGEDGEDTRPCYRAVGSIRVQRPGVVETTVPLDSNCEIVEATGLSERTQWKLDPEVNHFRRTKSTRVHYNAVRGAKGP
jgi:hypothetical protein